jgi:hypothetical protein
VEQAQSDAAEQQTRDGSASAGADDEDLRACAARKIDDLLRHGSAPDRVPRGGGLRVDAFAPQVLEGSLQRSLDLLLVGIHGRTGPTQGDLGHVEVLRYFEQATSAAAGAQASAPSHPTSNTATPSSAPPPTPAALPSGPLVNVASRPQPTHGDGAGR